jgi:hypothetical protein
MVRAQPSVCSSPTSPAVRLHGPHACLARAQAATNEAAAPAHHESGPLS